MSVSADAIQLADYFEQLAATNTESHWSTICTHFGWTRRYFDRVKHVMVNGGFLVDRKIAYEVYPGRGMYSAGAARYGTDPLISAATLDWNLGYLDTRTTTGIHLLTGYGLAYPSRKKKTDKVRTYWEAAQASTEDARAALA